MFESVLAPALALVIWSLLVWLWMYATRLPAMSKARLDPQDARFPGSLDVLPDGVRQVANNYNHLMEQPTIFYALAFITYLAGLQSPFTAGLAWGYVALRIVHSLIQNTVNRVPLRFLAFSLSTILLMVWAGCVALDAFA
ncbi:MAG: MAPEG family protein [Caulobacteraceae bacterium]|nr:MAG: MAPEG family protein [Caulobacteraceae bacterium]